MRAHWAVVGIVCGLVACSHNPSSTDAGGMDSGSGPGNDSGTTDAGVDAGLTSIPLQTSIADSGVSGAVEVVRDLYGNPHIYGNSLPDVAFAQGFLMAQDRLIEMDFLRHEADGSLGYLLGSADGAIIQQDIQMRLSHLRAIATQDIAALQASGNPQDALVVTTLNRFADGVNAYAAAVKAGKYTLPNNYANLWTIASFEPWQAVDSILLVEFLAFQLAFDPSDEIINTALLAEGTSLFDNGATADLKARAGIGSDLQVVAPADPTLTIPGWPGLDGGTSTARRDAPKHRKPRMMDPFRKLLADDVKALAAAPVDREARKRLRGSNNWIIGPQLTATGHVIVANDTHLGLTNPPIWYMSHLVNRGTDAPLDVMGVQLAGVPLILLGMNQHIAWAATVSYIDVTDVYQETIVPCANDAGPCVVFNGQNVPLVPRTEQFQLGYMGAVTSTKSFTLYDVPQHGPIIPRLLTDASGNVTGIDALRSTELSVRYTGYDGGNSPSLLLALDTAPSMQQAVAALDKDFKVGSQNWVIGDDQGNFGWTEIEAVPRRAPPNPPQYNLPWMVLPGDGSAEWGPQLDPHYIPHAYNPAQGFIATSNNDPIGVTLNNDPFLSQPVVGGAPLYLGWTYDPGTRVGRVTKRIQAFIDAGTKLAISDVQSIQADAISEPGQIFAPTFLSAAAAMAAEANFIGDGGMVSADGGLGPYPQLAGYLVGSDGGLTVSASLLQQAHDWIAAWSFDTPTGVAEDNPTAQQLADSRAQVVMGYWISYFAHDTFDDELAVFDQTQVQENEGTEEKLLAFICQAPPPAFLKTGVSPVTGDSILFDNLNTTGVVESKQMIAGQALIQSLQAATAALGSDTSQWQWGKLHTLTVGFFLGAGLADSLNLPPPGDATYPNGYPRHGENGTVDVGPHGLSVSNFAVADEGAAIRFVADLDPVNGPTARNVIPGGEIFDPNSPHYKDQLDLWRKNQTYDLAFKDADVQASALQEYQTNHIGRIEFLP